jgi:glyoxylase-like metal-dependent hydrolase (beta-lactamase superfamily II)
MAGASDVPEITPEELVRTIESGAPIRVLDVRAPEALAGGRIDILPAERFINIRGSEILSKGEAIAATLAPDGPVAVVCGRGNSSRQVVLHLNEIGFQAISLRGGMAAWADAVVPRKLRPPSGFDHFIQFDRIAKGALGYLLAAGGEAIIVDPPRKPQPYLEAARELGLKVVAVADTHAHADYISGGPALSRSLKIPYHLHAADAILPYDGSAAKIEFSALADGVSLGVGGKEIRVEHTPGHTEGSVSYLVGDDTAMTGDFLFVRSVGRPDLGGKTDEWTPVLWRSVDRARRTWDARCRVHPAHYATESEREPDRSVGRTLGSLSEVNEPLRLQSEGEFVAWVKAKVGTSPAAYRKIKSVNLGLVQIWEMEAQELEGGRNECALG